MDPVENIFEQNLRIKFYISSGSTSPPSHSGDEADPVKVPPWGSLAPKLSTDNKIRAERTPFRKTVAFLSSSNALLGWHGPLEGNRVAGNTEKSELR